MTVPICKHCNRPFESAGSLKGYPIWYCPREGQHRDDVIFTDDGPVLMPIETEPRDVGRHQECSNAEQ